jgi:hypothetical protein
MREVLSTSAKYFRCADWHGKEEWQAQVATLVRSHDSRLIFGIHKLAMTHDSILRSANNIGVASLSCYTPYAKTHDSVLRSANNGGVASTSLNTCYVMTHDSILRSANYRGVASTSFNTSYAMTHDSVLRSANYTRVASTSFKILATS